MYAEIIDEDDKNKLPRFYKICLQNFMRAADNILLTGLLVGYFHSRRKNGSDKISGGNQDGSDIFQNGSDIIRYPTVILSPASYEIYELA